MDLAGFPGGEGEPQMSVREPQMGLCRYSVLPPTLPGGPGSRDQNSAVQLVVLKETTFHTGNCLDYLVFKQTERTDLGPSFLTV